MADILIKGMELPKEGNVYLIIGEDGVVSEKIGSMYHVTTEAIGLPPHGRLIDYDWVKNRKAELEKHFFNDEEALCMAIDEAPIIVEAST